jgi:hypothetical protein
VLKIGHLGFHVGNPQCDHILLACCHDAGYVPVLRQYAAQSSCSERITLLSAGFVRSDINSLGFQCTATFESLFSSSGSTQPATYGKGQKPSGNVQHVLESTTSVSSSWAKEKPVSNSGRLGPVVRNAAGRRVDIGLSVDASLVQEIKNRNLCSWHYLRSDCQMASCKRNHNYPRPLITEEYDALWLFSRQGMCHRLRKGGSCDDDRCIYGHGFA